jgi:hypothetical protein
MSGPFGSSSFMYATGAAEEGQSLRFEDGDSAYLSRTPASAGDTKTWTWSGWVKRGNLGSGSYMSLFGAVSGVLNSYIAYNTTYQALEVGLGATIFRRTSAVFRDVSAWYHVVVASDTTQATAANRLKIYINNEEVTSFSSTTTLNQNGDWYINDTVAHAVGAIYPSGSAGLYFDGYLANVTLIDGQQLDPTSFGEYQDTLWKPKSDADIQSLTFGTNGFYLNFEDSSAIGDDTSGNANDWTANNLVATDVVLDSPVTGGNFATLNAVSEFGGTYSEGNLKYSGGSGFKNSLSTFAVTGGKWYAEVLAMPSLSAMFFGIRPAEENSSSHIGYTSGSYAYYNNGLKYTNTSGVAYGASWTSGDIISVAFDLDAGTIEFFKNNVSQGVAYTGIDTAKAYVVGITTFGTSAGFMNFGADSSWAGNETPQGNTDGNGQGDFYYAPPSGFLCLKTSSLPTPDITAPDEYFNTVLYSGNGSTQSITGVGFQADWVWGKERPNVESHWLFDSVRGATKQIESNSTNSESTQTTMLTSFDSDGFTMGSDGAGNQSGTAYVAWNWLAGGTAVSNTDGSITSQVSANTDAGFSVVGYTGNGSSSPYPTVGHGLSSTPEIIFCKTRDDIANWIVYHTLVNGSLDYLNLNTTSDNNNAAPSLPTSSVFYAGGDANRSGEATIAYCFHSVESYLKCGVYTGNGSADGPFIHCGFRPAWLMMKRTDDTSNWEIVDNKRDPENFLNEDLSANSNASENAVDGTTIDFTANGFKHRDGTSTGTKNVSGATYIFLAFAEAPFKSANAR